MKAVTSEAGGRRAPLHARVHGTRQLRLGKIRARLAQNLVGLSQLTNLALQRPHPLSHLGRHTGAFASVDLRLLHPLVQRLRRAADLGCDRRDRRPTGRMLMRVIQQPPNGMDAHARDPAPAGSPARGLQEKTCCSPCPWWLHLLRSCSLLSKRDGLLMSCGWHPASLLGEKPVCRNGDQPHRPSSS